MLISRIFLSGVEWVILNVEYPQKSKILVCIGYGHPMAVPLASEIPRNLTVWPVSAVGGIASAASQDS
jgi:hypothetical protein